MASRTTPGSAALLTPVKGGGPALRTLLLSDLVDSTRLVERLGDTRGAGLLQAFDRIARKLLREYGGREIDRTDGFLLLFDRPIDAVRYALDFHRELAGLSRDEATLLRARIGIHLGEVVVSIRVEFVLPF